MEKPAHSLPPDEIIRRIQRALHLAGNTHTWEDVKEGLKKGAFQIFFSGDGVAITEIVQFPQKRALHCWIVAGQMPGVMELQDRVIAHARTTECQLMTTYARKGWRKILPKYGWKEDAVIMTHEVPQ